MIKQPNGQRTAVCSHSPRRCLSRRAVLRQRCSAMGWARRSRRSRPDSAKAGGPAESSEGRTVRRHGRAVTSAAMAAGRARPRGGNGGEAALEEGGAAAAGRARPVTVTTASAEPQRPRAVGPRCPSAHAAESAALRRAAGAPLGECPGRAPRPPSRAQHKPRSALPASLPAPLSSAGRSPALPARRSFRGPRSGCHCSGCVRHPRQPGPAPRRAVGSAVPLRTPDFSGKVGGVCPCAPPPFRWC